MLHDIISAEYLRGYTIKITFDNGQSGIVDFSEYPSRGGVFSQWGDLEIFKKFNVDIAPETLYCRSTPL